MSQKQKILEHLQAGKDLSPPSALHLFGCLRLGARILELRRAGHRIVDLGPGRKLNFAVYAMVREAKPEPASLPPWERRHPGSLFPLGPARRMP